MIKWNSCDQLKFIIIDIIPNGINNKKIPMYEAIITPTHELQGNKD